VDAQFARNMDRILSVTQEGVIRIWDARSGRESRQAMQPGGLVNGATFFKNESHIVSWSKDGSIRLWDVQSGQQIGPALKHNASVTGVSVLPDERRIVSWSEDGTVRTWNIDWRGDTLTEIACNYSARNEQVTIMYGVNTVNNVCN
jgi:WD40 repeat protein